MLDALWIVQLQDLTTVRWHASPEEVLPSPAPDGFEATVEAQHRANFDLWHEEDGARDPAVPDGVIAQRKRAIDSLNQRRNDLAEQVDLALLASLELTGGQNRDAPLHSETPGLIIDRLSILALKIFHTAEQTQRDDVDPTHRARNERRLAVLHTQRDDLAGCLATLWLEINHGHRRFKLYKQLKMYNDPTLNPVLYQLSRDG